MHEPDAWCFSLTTDVRLVQGACRAALYDLRSGDVYSVDGRAAALLTALDQGAPLAAACARSGVSPVRARAYCESLVQRRLGAFAPRQTPAPTQPERPRDLTMLWLELTEGCNLRCLHCYSESSPEAARRDQMQHEDWLRVISEGRRLGCQRLQFIGGEPFLYGPKLFALADHARAEGIPSIEVFTNGTLLRDEQIGALREREMRVAVSVYGATRQVHGRVTLSESSFTRTSSALRALVAAGVQTRVAIIAMKTNQDEVAETTRWLRQDLGITDVSVDVVRPSGRGCGVDLLPDAAFRRGFSLRSPSFPPVHRATFDLRQGGHDCFSGDLCITATGDAFPCIMERGQPIGSVLGHPLAALWASDRARAYQTLTKDQINGCKSCEYRYACFDCRPKAASNAGGDWLAKPAWCHYDPQRGAWRAHPHEED